MDNIWQGRKVNLHIWAYIQAAEKLGLSVTSLTPSGESLVKFIRIKGDNKEIDIYLSAVSINNVTGAMCSKSKPMTNMILSEQGISVPSQIVWADEQPITKSDLKNINFPVVVKPKSLSGGKGISVNVSTLDHLNKAILFARKQTPEWASNKVLIEEMLPGDDHRFLVLDDKVIAVARKEPASVVGDGRSTVAELIETAHPTKFRQEKIWKKIVVNEDTEEALTMQKMSLDSIPVSHETVQVHSTANLSQGGVVHNVTDTVHHSFKEVAVQAAQAIGLRLAGVDILAEDVSQPTTEQKYGVIEVNTYPGMRLHTHSASGEPTDAPYLVLKKIFDLN